jgi:hypothetical protein
MLLAETKMAEVQAGAVPFKSTEDRLAGYFGIRYPGYSWRIEIEPCEIENLYLMTLEIAFNPTVVEEQIANPDLEVDFDDEAAQIIRTVHRLVPTPADLDLNRDFGIDLEGLQEQMGGGGEGGGGEGGGGEGGGGGGASELWALINDFLTQHPEILNESGGIDLEAVKNLPAEDFQMAMEILQQFVGRGANLGDLQDQLGENLGGGEGGGGRGGQGGGRGGQGGSGGGGRGGQDGSGGGQGGGRDGQDGGRDGQGGAGGNAGNRDGNTGGDGGRPFGGPRSPNNQGGPNRGNPNNNDQDRNNPPSDSRRRPNNSNQSGGRGR